MKISLLISFSVSAALLMLLSGCASQQARSTDGALPLSGGTQAGRHASWMESGSSSDDLLYVSNQGNGTVTVYTYQTQQLVGTLTGFSFPQGICAHGRDVWITDRDLGEIVEYAHGGTKPLRRLKDDNGPLSCAIEARSGNLAVVNSTRLSSNLWVYDHAKGKPTVYNGGGIRTFYASSYDQKGNLWVNGFAYSSASSAEGRSAVLLRGHATLSPVNLRNCTGGCDPPRLWSQWVGKSWLVWLNLWHVNHHLRGKLLQTLRLGEDAGLNQYFVTPQSSTGGREIIGAVEYQGEYGAVNYWSYPTGGNPNVTITEGMDLPFGVAVSYSK